MAEPTCWFCGSGSLDVVERGRCHPVRPEHGPFDFLRCRECRSGITANPPTREQLAALYASFQDGVSELQRRITRDDPQTAWYARCVDRVVRRTGRREDEE